VDNRLATVLVLTLSTREAAILLVHPTLTSDFARYQQLAVQASQSGPLFTDVPTGLPMLLGAIYAVLGVNVLWAELLNLAAALGTAWLVYELGGFVPALVFALLPEHVLMVTLPATEPLYAFLLTLAVYLASRKRRWLLTGLVVGVSQYVRASAEVVLAGLAFVAGRRFPAMLAGALLVLVPVIAWNASQGRVSTSTSSYLGWQLLIGSNQEYGGHYNDADLAYAADPMPVALERITSDPVGYAGLAVREIANTWTEESYAPYWTGSPYWLDLACELGLLAVFLTAIGGRGLNPAALGVLVAFTLAFGLIETQGRYHYALLPVLLILRPWVEARDLVRRPALTSKSEGVGGVGPRLEPEPHQRRVVVPGE